MDAIENYLAFRNVGKTIDDLETPTSIIDIAVVENNIKRWQKQCDKLQLANRPHIKTHKIAGLARYQLAAGAKGITVQKLGEAEVMADAGINDMLLTFNVIGRQKLERLANLARRTSISVVADSQPVTNGLSMAATSAGRTLSVLVECDTGAGRNGVQSPQQALQMAMLIDRADGLSFGGLMTYPAPSQRQKTHDFVQETLDLCTKSGLEVKSVSSGGTPDMWNDEGLSAITEYRVGTYVYFDRSMVSRNTCSFDDCALSMLTTVVSVPTSQRAIVDAGTKSLTSDLLGMKGYGVVPALGGAEVYTASEEHGFVDTSHLKHQPAVGDRIKITPNHVCPVVNLFDEVVFVRGAEVLGAVKVDARGRVQ
jgi:D-serine deaminase-like pyridoxal phosphate-dependent protein